MIIIGNHLRARALLERQIIYMTSQSREPRSRDNQAQPKCKQDGAKHRTKEQRRIQNPLPYYRPRKAGREPRSHSNPESRGKTHSRTSEGIAEGEASTEPNAESSQASACCDSSNQSFTISGIPPRFGFGPLDSEVPLNGSCVRLRPFTNRSPSSNGARASACRGP